MTDGVVIVDKPSGMTSHDVVDRVRKVFNEKRVGHAGTLDPDATGVLVLGLGKATRLLSYAQSAPKTYRAVATLGITTTTLDASGEIVDKRPADFDQTDVEAVVASFEGEIEQVPPMVSAVKVGGERLYKKARRGENVERRARKVTIYELKPLAYEPPDLTLMVRCSAGTYVRTLVADIGERLGCGAHLKTLRRTESGGFEEGDAFALDVLDPENLLPIAAAVQVLERLELDDEQVAFVRHGRPLLLGIPKAGENEPVALFHDGSLLAVYRRAGNSLIADRVMPQ
jgi:tRNA pseudouridine55 synthase